MADTPKSSERTRAYERGYAAAARHAWPEHKPPQPPAVVVSELMHAAAQLRDEAESFCATIDADDEIYKNLSRGIDALDAAMIRVTAWLRSSIE